MALYAVCHVRHGDVFRSFSPPFDASKDPENPHEASDFSLVLPAQLREAKKRWPKSAPGKDGVTASAVTRCLAVLYNILIATGYQQWSGERCALFSFQSQVRIVGTRTTGGPLPSVPLSAPQRLLHRVLANRMSNAVSMNVNLRGFVRKDGTLRFNTFILSMDLKKLLIRYPTTPY